jgi:arylsulfatase A-like enzyme
MKWIAPFFCLIFLLQCSRGERPPNVIHIVADDLGVMDVGFMGDGRYHTPHIDRLASEGMVFTNGYAPAANCAPSRACVMTGQNPMFHGVYTVGNSDRGKARTRKIIPTPNTKYVADEHVLLTEVFKEQGYLVAQVGKWHIGHDPETQGVDINVAGDHRGGPGTYFSPYRVPHLEDGPEGEYLTDRLTTEAIKILEAHKDEKFFLYFPFYTVHMPIQGKPELIKKYANRDDVNPEYAAMVESLDENVGRLMEALDRLGLTENTIVVFTSDNGGIRDISPQDPYRAGKGSYYEGGVRVPFAVRWPGVVESGTTNDIPVTGLDFYPTYLDILGQKTEKELDGTSLAPLLKGEGTIETRPLFWHFPIYLQAYNPKTDDGRDPLFRTRPGSTMRYGKWKLHHYFEDMAYELYDLEADPGERKDLAGDMPDKLAELTAMLDAWREKNNAPIPQEPNPEYRPQGISADDLNNEAGFDFSGIDGNRG